MKYPATLSTPFDFGPYAGKTVEEVCDVDPHYVTRCLDDIDDFELDPGAKRYWKDCLDGVFSRTR